MISSYVLWLMIFLIFVVFIFPLSKTVEINVSVDCHSRPDYMLVRVETENEFRGLLYVSSHYGDPYCSSRGTMNTTTILSVPFHRCNTTEKKPGLFMNRITVQQHLMIVSAGDGEYEVGCQMFEGDLLVNSDNKDMGINNLDTKFVPTSVTSEPEVLLRIYDFENDVFVDKVRLGQVVELEVTIRDGRVHQGRLKDCDASNGNGTLFPVIKNYCPVDLSVSDKVYVDDQSRITGDYYLYIPFRMFRFLEGTKVSFTCNVIVCQHGCPAADCGDYEGMSYGRRRKRSSEENHVKMTVTSQVQVVDGDHRVPRATGQGIVEEEVAEPKAPPAQVSESSSAAPRSSTFSIPTEYLVGGVSLVLGLLISVSVNVYLLLIIRRRLHDTAGSSCEDMATDTQTSFFAPRGSPYESLSTRCDLVKGSNWNSGSRFRYDSDWNLPTRYDVHPESYSISSKWFGKPDNREILYPPMPIRQSQSTRRSHSFRY